MQYRMPVAGPCSGWDIDFMELIDFYKSDHRRQYIPGVSAIQANWTPRASRLDTDYAVLVGLQYFEQRYLIDCANETFFWRDRQEVCEEYEATMLAGLGPNTIGTDHIKELWDLQYLPIEILALPEGTRVPIKVPQFIVNSTHKNFYWLPNYLESLDSNIMWMPCNSGTIGAEYRTILNHWADKTGGDPSFVPWQGHDFSFRGMAGIEAARLSALGHLLSFTGTDTVPVLRFIRQYYGGSNNGLVGGSVTATEHSVMCAGSQEGELETIRRLIKLYPSGILSVVSDTWDLWKVLTVILPQLKEEILARDGKFVVRPDSGNPADILCGDPKAPKDSPAFKGVVELLWDLFGGTYVTNGPMTPSEGFRILDPHIGAIYGDSITRALAQEICERLAAKRFASTNVVFGIGSFTYQYNTRDSLGFAMKATWAEINGVGHNLFKKPVTDSGMKNSATGRLAVYRSAGGALSLYEKATPEQEQLSAFELTFRNSKIYRHQSLQDVRKVLWPECW